MSKAFYLFLWIPLTVVLCGICFALAWRAYPHYQMSNHDISYLGHPALNPKGWWYWSIGMGIASLMTCPLVAHASRRMEALAIHQPQTIRRLVFLGSISLHGSCLGTMGLALAPQGPTFDLIHKTSGAFALGGMYLTLLLLWLLPLLKIRPMSAPRLALFVVSAGWGVVGFLVTQGYRFFIYGELGHDLKHKGESLWLRFSLWEWMLFVAAATSFALLIALLPERVETAD